VDGGSSPAKPIQEANGAVWIRSSHRERVNALAAGITIGCIYGLMLYRPGLIFGVMKIVNFAQGELLMLGMSPAFTGHRRRVLDSSVPISGRSSARSVPARSCSPVALCCTSS